MSVPVLGVSLCLAVVADIVLFTWPWTYPTSLGRHPSGWRRCALAIGRATDLAITADGVALNGIGVGGRRPRDFREVSNVPYAPGGRTRLGEEKRVRPELQSDLSPCRRAVVDAR
jgi:hypothetical protein